MDDIVDAAAAAPMMMSAPSPVLFLSHVLRADGEERTVATATIAVIL